MNATAMTLPQSLEEHSIVLIGANSAHFENRALSRDPRLRCMSLEKACGGLLRSLSNVRAVVWFAKSMDRGKKMKLEQIIDDLRGPNKWKVVSFPIFDEHLFESTATQILNRQLGAEPEPAAAADSSTPTATSTPVPPPPPTEVSAPVPISPPTPTAEPPQNPTGPRLLPPPVKPTLPKARIARNHYEEVLGDAKTLLPILHREGYPTETLDGAKLLIYNAKAALKVSDPDLLERVRVRLAGPEESQPQAPPPEKAPEIVPQRKLSERLTAFREQLVGITTEVDALIQESLSREEDLELARQLAERLRH